jgi:PAS domain S-box-containing protein
LALASAVSLFANLLIPPAHAQLQPPQYVTRVWHTGEGLPQNSVNAVLQDDRGYIWIGTFGGLARFDGERFTVFDAANTPGFGSNQIFSLYESRSGTLWIGTVDGGVIRLQDGVATTYTERDGLPNRWITSIRGDVEGKVWINTAGDGVALFAGTKLEAYPTYRGRAVGEFYLQARDGSMWFRCGQDLVRFGADGGVATLHPPKPSVFLVHEAGDGSVWVGLRDQYRLVRYSQGVFSEVRLPPVRRSQLTIGFLLYSFAMTEGADGELLLHTPAGLVRIVDGRVSPPEVLPLPAKAGELLKVRDLLVDREGDLWVGTVGTGLIRLRRAPLTAYGKDEGLSDSNFSSVFQDREGRIWLGGDLLYCFDGRRFHQVPGVTDVLAIAQTRDGDLWFGAYGGLYRLRSGVLSHFNANAPAVKVIFQDREGTLWIGALTEDRPGGLYRFRGGKLEPFPGISDVRAIAEDRDGGLWLGGLAGLSYMHNSNLVTYGQKQGLSSNSVYDIHQDSAGTLWVATYGGGLNRFRDGRFKPVSTQDGLPDNLLLALLEDGKGNLWFNSNQSVFRLSLKELNDFADGKISFLSPVSYGTAEGMRSTESNGGSPGGWITGDGRIWFPTLRGVVAIDPDAGSRTPPPVVLEEAWANKLALALNGRTSAPPGSTTFDFRFTALSFSAPEEVRFKYRLDPYDKGWVDAGNQRTAHYTNMAPGEYSFHVIAENSFGIRNNQEASVRFVLQPRFYQTSWFRGLALAALLAFLWGLHQLRVHQLRQQEAKFREAVEAMPALAFVATPDGELTYVNKQWMAYTGLTAEAVFGQGWQNAVHPEDVGRLLEQWQASTATGRPLECEARYRRGSDGEYRCFYTRAAPLRDKRGKIRKWCGVATDIEDRKRGEDALRHLNRELRAVGGCNQVLVRATDEQELLNEICRVVHEKAGYGMAWVGYVEGNAAQTVRPVAWAAGEEGCMDAPNTSWTAQDGDPISAAIRTGKTAFVQDFFTDARWREKRPQGGYRSSIALPLKNEGGALFGVFTISSSQPYAFTPEEVTLLEELAGDLAFGITVLRGRIERKRAEDEVRRLQSEERYRQQRLMEVVLDSLESGIVACDAGGRLTLVNRKARALLGVGPEHDPAGRPATDLRLCRADGRTPLSPEERPLLQALRGHPTANVEVVIPTQSGETNVVLISSQPLRDAEGSIFGAVSAWHDITERKALEVQLRHAQKLEAIGQLAAGIAHEINTPAQFVGDNLQFLRKAFEDLLPVLETYRQSLDALKDVPAAAEFLRRIAEIESLADSAYLEKDIPLACESALEGVSRIFKIVGAMKGFAHTDLQGKAVANLNQALENTCTIAHNEYKYVAGLETDLAELPDVFCDLSSLNQVFLNLLINASHAIADVVKSSGQHGTIRIRSAVEGDFVRISIEDTGCGIPEQIRHRVFDPFFTTKEVGRGTGQGLAIARSIVVDKHHGSLTFTSELGKGTTFTILLPIDGKAHPLPKP